MSGIQAFMQPNVPPMNWSAFRTATAPFSVALDGYVATGPRFDPHGPRANFNHHEEVSRPETRATCAQVLMRLRQRFFDRFRDTSGPRADVYMNDCDEDVCLSWFLLKHADLASQAINPLLNRLVNLEDMLDTTAGAYAYPRDLAVLGELAWVFEPYRRFRLSGQLDKRAPNDFLGVLTDVENRIRRHIIGSGDTIPLDMRYNRIGGGLGWMMVHEIGPHARTGMFSDGITAFASVRERTDGRWTIVIGCLSDMIPFNLKRILKRCNEEEGTAGSPDRWGGSGGMVIGSPRIAGSALDPDRLTAIIESAK